MTLRSALTWRNKFVKSPLAKLRRIKWWRTTSNSFSTNSKFSVPIWRESNDSSLPKARLLIPDTAPSPEALAAEAEVAIMKVGEVVGVSAVVTMEEAAEISVDTMEGVEVPAQADLVVDEELLVVAVEAVVKSVEEAEDMEIPRPIVAVVVAALMAREV